MPLPNDQHLNNSSNRINSPNKIVINGTHDKETFNDITSIIPKIKNLNGKTALLMFGSGDFGSLGMGEDNDLIEKIPKLMETSLNKYFKYISCGSVCVAAIDSNGKIYTWGPNDGFCLGRDKPPEMDYKPGLVKIPSKSKAKKVTVGDEHMVALLENGDVYSWGSFRGSTGRVGHHFDFKFNRIQVAQKIPYKINIPGEYKAIDIASGNNHAVILNSIGLIYSFGVTNFGNRFSKRLLKKDKELEIKRMLVTPINVKFQSVYCGSYTTFAIDGKSNLYSAGLNNYWQLGISRIKLKINNKFRKVDIPKGEKIVKVTAGNFHTICLTKNKKVFSWGRNASGCLGRKTPLSKQEYENVTPEFEPSKKPMKILAGVKDICSGSDHNMYVNSNGNLCGFGITTEYRLGINTEKDIKPGEFKEICSNLKKNNLEIKCMDGGSQFSAVIVSKIRMNTTRSNRKRKIERKGKNENKKLRKRL